MANGDVYTSAGEGFVIDAIDAALTTPFVGSGTGTTTPDKADTTLGTEVGTRASGSKTQPTADVLRVVGTCSYTGTHSIAECGLFTASSAGTLIQHHVFGATTPIGVVNGDSIEFTINHEQA